MRAPIQIKLLAMCVVLIILTTGGTSLTYYALTRQDKQRESRQRIRVAFEILLDDLRNRQQQYADQCAEFVRESASLPWALYSYGDDPAQLESAQFLVTYLARAAAEVYNFSGDSGANRLQVFAADGRLLAAYQRAPQTDESPESRDVVGIYALSSAKTPTFLPTNDPSQNITSFLIGDTPIPEQPLPASLDGAYDGEMPDEAAAAPFAASRRIGIRVAAPVKWEGQTVGAVVGEIPYTRDHVERYAALSETDINLFAGNVLSVGTLPAQSELDADALRQSVACDGLQETKLTITPVDIGPETYYQGRCTLRDAAGETVGTIAISLSQAIEQREIRKILLTVLAIGGLAFGLAIALSWFATRGTVRAVRSIVRGIAAAAEGDLRPTALAATHDEIGLVARKLNQMLAQLRAISGQIQQASQAVGSTAAAILQQMDRLVQHVQDQSASVDETTRSVTAIKEFIDVVAHNTNELLAVVAQVSSAVRETRASIAEVRTSTETLSTNVLAISASIAQVNQAVKQIGRNVEALEEAAHHTETEVAHIDQSLRDVARNADQTRELARATMDAASQGQMSVDASIQGMTELKDVVADTARIIGEVNAWSEQVSSILGIVDDITEQTSLLSLNASIISAQAGVHGRGFAVVAEEIKELATRTKSSTQEIGTLIRSLRQTTEEGVRNTGEGLQKADQGVQLASDVSKALETILASATRSSSGADDTTRVISQTVDRSRAIGQHITHVTEMVSAIRAAIREQQQDVEQVVSAVEELGGMAEQVNGANAEQQRATEEIERSMLMVTEQFDDISDQTGMLQQNSDQIIDAMQAIEAGSEYILHNTTRLSKEHVAELVRQAEILQKIVAIFKLS